MINMIIGVVFKNGVEIERGIWTGGKHWIEAYPKQSITICQDNINSEEKSYVHDGEITFQELQDNGNGWEVVYDSNERIDRTVEYDLPKWFSTCERVPIHEHKMNKEGTIDTEFKGYYK
jgi:hypothetical protein